MPLALCVRCCVLHAATIAVELQAGLPEAQGFKAASQRDTAAAMAKSILAACAMATAGGVHPAASEAGQPRGAASADQQETNVSGSEAPLHRASSSSGGTASKRPAVPAACKTAAQQADTIVVSCVRGRHSSTHQPIHTQQAGFSLLAQ